MKVILYQPGVYESGLISDKALFAGASIYAILDPDNLSVAAQEIAVKLGLPVLISIGKDNIPEGAILVYPDSMEHSASLSDTAHLLNIAKCSTSSFHKMKVPVNQSDNYEFSLDEVACDFNRLDHAIAVWCSSTAMKFNADFVSVAIEIPDSKLLLIESDNEGSSRFGIIDNGHPGWQNSILKSRKLKIDSSENSNGFIREYLPLTTTRFKSALSVEFSNSSHQQHFADVTDNVLGTFADNIDLVISNSLDRLRPDLALKAMATILDLNENKVFNPDVLAQLFGSDKVEYYLPQDVMSDQLVELKADAKDGFAFTDEFPATLVVIDESDFTVVFHGKTPAHQLDGSLFSKDDALFALKLLPTFKNYYIGASCDSAVGSKMDLLARLKNEIDRSNRYHTSFSLTVIKLSIPVTPLLRILIESVRSSDSIAMVDDNTIAIVAPEESQSVSRFERRLIQIIKEVITSDKLVIQAGRVTYPGKYDNAEELFESAISKTIDK
ncbi:hypothetical protein HN388_04315 [bacterium]|nr:hypothetical protein [bacterium]MBT7310978.1 hypothetical protein [bacterium]